MTVRRVDSWFTVAAWLGLLSLTTGCPGGPKAVPLPQLDPEHVATAAIAGYDRNRDGFLSGEEIAPSLKFNLDELDTNKNGRLEREEIQARVQTYVEGGVGRKTQMCSVMLDGQPLAGAEVTFEPEIFFEGKLQPAKGVTDVTGSVAPTVEGTDPPGVGPGFYIVKISKLDASGKETIPAKFNSQTTLGVEVPAVSMKRGDTTPRFDLKSR